jgi:hypothetical protein
MTLNIPSTEHRTYTISRWRENEYGEGVDEAVKSMAADLMVWVR